VPLYKFFLVETPIPSMRRKAKINKVTFGLRLQLLEMLLKDGLTTSEAAISLNINVQNA
jgi:hypothetical protein